MISRSAVALGIAAMLGACTRDPAIVHREAGDGLLASSDFKGAAAEYAQSLAVTPAQPQIWSKLAFAKLKAGDRDGAAEALSKQAEYETTPARKADACRNAAGLYLQTREQDKAERYLLEAVRADPTDASSLAWLGELASVRGGARRQQGPVVPAELEKAIEWYGRVIALRPEDRSALANRRIAIVKYLGAIEDERSAQAARLKRAGKDAAAAAADASARVARAEAKKAELDALLADTNAKLAPARPAAATAK